MSLEIAISPGGRLFVEQVPETVPEVEQKMGAQLCAAFEKSAAAGLLLLATDALTFLCRPRQVIGAISLEVTCNGFVKPARVIPARRRCWLSIGMSFLIFFNRRHQCEVANFSA
jgi:hypothetical protein